MGAGHSQTRRVTLSNDDKSGVIKVSDAVVQRLKAGPTVAEAENPQPQNVQPLQKTPAARDPSDVYTEPSLTSLQILQEKEEELRKNDQYWEQRLAKLQETHCKIDKVLEEEFTKAKRDITVKFASTGNKSCDPPCQDLKCQVLQCYSTNSKSSLACAKIVKSFTDCVNTSRLHEMEIHG